MQRFKIAVIPGDGVGQEVVPAALEVLEEISKRFDTSFDLRHFDWGAEYYFKNGRMMPPDALDQLRGHGCDFAGRHGRSEDPRSCHA